MRTSNPDTGRAVQQRTEEDALRDRATELEEALIWIASRKCGSCGCPEKAQATLDSVNRITKPV